MADLSHAFGFASEERKPHWNTIETAPPDEVVWTKIDDEDGERNVAKLKRRGRLWFMPDDSMYVYYTPTHWHR